MTRIALFLSLAFVITGFFIPAYAETVLESYSTSMKLIEQFEGGTLYEAGKVKVVDLKGGYRQMGRQLGYLQKDDLNAVYRIIKEQYIDKNNISFERLKTIAYAFYDIYPLRYKEIFIGMTETSGMTLEEVVIINALEFFPKINHLVFNCSALVVWKDYTKDGSVIFGRNNDDSPLFRNFAPYLTVTVLSPDDGSNPTAIVNYAGVLYAANGMNSKGIFLELNSGPWEGFYLRRPSVFVSLLTYLQDFSTMELIDAAILSSKVNMSSIITMADTKKAYSLECSCHNAKRREGDNRGILAATNHFVDSQWGLSQIDDAMGGLTIKRYENLLALGEKYKGQFDAKKMMEVFDTLIKDGGATEKDNTIYQIVVLPKIRKMWIKAPEVFDWTEIDLIQFLND